MIRVKIFWIQGNMKDKIPDMTQCQSWKWSELVRKEKVKEIIIKKKNRSSSSKLSLSVSEPDPQILLTSLIPLKTRVIIHPLWGRREQITAISTLKLPTPCDVKFFFGKTLKSLTCLNKYLILTERSQQAPYLHLISNSSEVPKSKPKAL